MGDRNDCPHHTYKYIHTHSVSVTHTHTHTHTHARTHARTHTCTHVRTHWHAHSDTIEVVCKTLTPTEGKSSDGWRKTRKQQQRLSHSRMRTPSVFQVEAILWPHIRLRDSDQTLHLRLFCEFVKDGCG